MSDELNQCIRNPKPLDSGRVAADVFHCDL